ncbi:MAG: glycosyltransferase [Anaerolineales bacterium]|nr:glycosyltransferase [Anaerolineales bacterium]
MSADLKTIALYTADAWDSALVHLRVRGPAAAAGVAVLGGNHADAIDLAPIEAAQVVILQRDFPRFGADYEAVARRAQALGKPVVHELDDLLLDVPLDHCSEDAYTDHLFDLLGALVAADGVTAATPALAEALRPLNPTVAVWPNCLDDSLWRSRPPAPAALPSAERPLVIGYMGGATHQPDVAEIAPALLNVLARHGPAVRAQFWGGPPPAALAAHPQVAWAPLDLPNYAAFAAAFQAQHFDIAVAPLRDRPFNRCKSHLKFLEYSALGVPGVYARLEPYTGLVTDGENGLLAAAPGEWEAALHALIESPALRERLARAAQATVEQGWRLSARAGEWRALYAAYLTPGRPPALNAAHRAGLAAIGARARTRQAAVRDALQAEVRDRDQQLAELRAQPAWRLAQTLTRWRGRLAPDGSARQRLLDRLVRVLAR